MSFLLTPQTIIEAYRLGYFPMAESADAKKTYLISPETRGQLPIEDLHIPRSLLKKLRREAYEIRLDSDFEAVIRSCATQTKTRKDTWINEEILEIFLKLRRMGHAHSVEYYKDGSLEGGLYGLALGGAFFGESMFSRRSEASKIALVHLVARLWKGGFTLLDTQWSNAHLKQFGCFEIPRGQYMDQLQQALEVTANF
jgi:leucyl/phenylalanyl-tRNA--protein transferase